MPAALISTIKGLGLSIGETVVLGVLLRDGPLYASQIAKETRLNRTTTYGFLNELIEKGLVSKVKARNATQFHAIAPELLPDYIARKRADLQQKEQELREAMPQILLMRRKVHILPRVQFFEGEEGVKQAYEDTVQNNKGRRLLNIAGVHAVLQKFDQKWVTSYLEKRVAKGIVCTDIAPASEWAQESQADDAKYLRATKLLPRGFGFDAEIALYDNKIGIFSCAHENPIALIIEDETIAHSMKQLFTYIESTLS